MACFVGRFVAFASGATLMLLDTETGVTTRHKVHTQEIVAVKGGRGGCVTGGKDGKLVVWAFPHYEVTECGAPIRLFACTSSKCYFVRGSIVHINVLSLSSHSIESEALLKGKIEGATDLATLPDESGLVVLSKTGILVFKFDAREAVFFAHEVQLTCMSVSPDGESVAVGDALGQIVRIFINAGGKTKTHWHSHAVKTLTFTPDTTLLLSGGEEGVIVLWHESTHNKTFFPRLESPILSIVVSEDCSMYAVRLLDNSVKVFQAADYAKIAQFQGLTDPTKMIPGTKIAVSGFDADCVCLNASPGFIQIFSLSELKVMQRLNCSKRNQVSRSQVEYPNPVQVVSVAFSKDGKTIATVERADCQHFRVAYLKFWGDGMKLNTLVLNPHNNNPLKVISLLDNFTSLGRLGTIISWSPSTNPTNNSQTWLGSRETTYRNLSLMDGCEFKGTLCAAFEMILVRFDSDFQVVSVAYEDDCVNFKQIAAVEVTLIAATAKVKFTQKVYVFSESLAKLWSVDLFLVHNVYASKRFFSVSLNPASYTPMEIREKYANIVLKFSPDSEVPNAIFKVDEPKAVFMHE